MSYSVIGSDHYLLKFSLELTHAEYNSSWMYTSVYILELQAAILIPEVSYASYGSCGFLQFLQENSGI